MTDNRNSNSLIKGGVFLCDFIVLNVLLSVYQSHPDLLEIERVKLYYFVPNMALVFAEMLFHTIINYRLVSFPQILMRTGALALTQSAVTFFALHYLTEMNNLTNMLLLHFVVFYLLLVATRFVERIVLRWFRSMGRNTCRVLFVGNDRVLLDLYRDLGDQPATGYQVLGYYADEDIAEAPERLKRLGTLEELRKLTASDALADQPHEIYCCLSHDYADYIVKLMRYCNSHIVHFYYVPRKFGEFHVHMQPELLGGTFVFSNLSLPLLQPANRVLKRTFDILFSTVVCLCTLPLIPFIYLLQQWQSRGPLLFRQKRTGLNGRDFYCYKFRTMHVNQDADRKQATANDPRKFPFGNFMRKTNIDELPQFFNVLIGDMSIVGPRPHMLHHTEIYSELIGRYMMRHFCKPGITGWAQVTGFRGETRELWEMKERIRRDIWYIEHYSFWLDLRIIGLTIVSIIRPDKNAY